MRGYSGVNLAKLEPVLCVGDYYRNRRYFQYTLAQVEKDIANGKQRPWAKLLEQV
jgi:hypothetical protein